MKKVKILISTLALGTVLFFASCTKDECKDVTCDNGGVCTAGVCDCATGFEGTNCETKMNAKFVASYNGSDVCSSGPYTYTATIAASSTIANGLVINNFGGFGSSFTATATVDGSNVTIPSQTVSGLTISGSGTLNSDATNLQLTYTAFDGTDTDNCTSTWTKQ
jgi:hypothetical protein